MDNSVPSPFLPPIAEDIARTRELLKEYLNPWISVLNNRIRPELSVEEIIRLYNLDEERSPWLKEKQNDLMA